MQDQITCIFQFKITAVKLTYTPPKTNPSQQTILFKLGTAQGRCHQLNQSVIIVTNVLYSKTLNKFCPIKGLVKIYDVNKDGSQMISCVGAFNTQQLVNENIDKIVLERNIGPCQLTMIVEVSRMENQRSDVKQIRESSSEKTVERREKSTRKDNNNQNYPQILNITDTSIEIQSRRKSEQIAQQRLKNTRLQQKLQKQLKKNEFHTNKIKFMGKQIGLMMEKFKKFLDLLENDSKDQLWLQIHQKLRQICLKYHPNHRIKQQFVQFITFMQNKHKQHQTNISLYESESYFLINQSNKPLQPPLTPTLGLKTQQIALLQNKINKLAEQTKNFQAINQYLKQKDIQMENIIAAKQCQIDNLKKVIYSNNQDIDSLSQRNKQLNKMVDNLQLMIEEMKEQIYNLSETIENYRKKYGDLKQTKDKALEQDLRECLRWIDHHHQEELTEMEDTNASDSAAMTSFMMKSIDHIEDMPLEQISQIRSEVVNVLKKLDQLLNRS